MAFNNAKTDATMGQLVHEYLVQCGVETPMVSSSLTREEKLAIIEENTRSTLQTLGLDLTDDSLAETPTRVAKMYVDEIYWGLDYNAFPKCTTVDNKMSYDEMVVEHDINISSGCEHHLQPIVGKAHVAYIPKSKVLGLSKIPRIVEYFAKRPQIQERLTEQVYHALQYILGTDDIAVTIVGEHMCVSQRGVEDQSAYTTTTKLGGCFKSDRGTRSEYFNHIYNK